MPDKGAAPLQKPQPIRMEAKPAPLPISDSMDELGDIFGDPGSQLASQDPEPELEVPEPVAPAGVDDVLAGISLDFDDAPLPDIDSDIEGDSDLPDLPDELSDEFSDEIDVDDAALADIDLDGGLDIEAPAPPPAAAAPAPDPGFAAPPDSALMFDPGAGAVPGQTAQFMRGQFDEVPQSQSMPDPDFTPTAGLADDDDDALALTDDLDAPAPPPLAAPGLPVSAEELGSYAHKIEKFAEEFENEGKIAEAAFMYELKAFLDSLGH